MNFREAVGLVIKQERIRQGFKQWAFAEAIGTEQSSWSRVERGVAMLPVERLDKLCEVLDIEASDLLLRARRTMELFAREPGVRHE